MGLTVDQVLDLPGLIGTIVVGGATGTRRIVRHVVVEEPDAPLGSAGPDVLVVLAGRLATRDPAQSRAVIERLHRAGSGALAFRSEGGQGNAAGEVPTWSSDFDQWTAELLADGDVDGLAGFRDHAPGMPWCHPTVEHFIPLFVTFGAASAPPQSARTTIDGYMMGLSRRSFQLG